MQNLSPSILFPWRDREFLLGVGFLLLSLGIFCYPLVFPIADSDFGMGRFVLNYLIVLFYLMLLLGTRRLKKGQNGLAPLFILLTLSLVSCYSLNREINIFETSTTWWSVLLVVCCANYLTLPFFRWLAGPLQLLVCGIAGVSLLAFTYLAIFLMPFYPGCLFFFFVLGLSLHTFVPLLFVIYTLVFIVRVGKENRRLRLAFVTGFILAMTIAIQFTIRWQLAVRNINYDYAAGKGTQGKDLPAWVYVAQHGSPGAITEKILKTGIVYSESSDWDFSWMPKRLFNEQRKHDPLIVVASLFSGKSDLPDEDRVKVLESMYDSRYQAQDRLWSGEGLVTTSVDTHVQFWPRLHLSYTEENITVADRSTIRSGNSQREAIYTFHLPEGGLVSSLSLWIDGTEQKGVLTSRGKADTAYRTVVGVYRRDPSVVHWQEGNTVSVRVFPVPPQTGRRFKIGITAPLEKDGQDLVYRNSYFDGPSGADAAGTIHVQPMEPVSGLQQPRSWDTPLEYKGGYTPAWELRFRDKGVANTSFRFNGKQYTTEACQPAADPLPLRQVYLDINKSWTREEFETIFAALPDSRLFAYSPDAGLVPLTSGNKDAVFDDLSDLQFSLFPLSLITDRAGSLLISKSTLSSPSIADIRESKFPEQLQNSFAATGRICLFHLGPQLSPYLKTLKECGAFRFEAGDMATLKDHIRQHRFAGNTEQKGVVVIDPAGILIRRSDWAATGQPASGDGIAPDHLLRLFAYRRIMQQLSGRLPDENPGLNNQGGDESIVDIAKEAHIVSPVSSLIVLESQADYARFTITESKNSLKNASLQGKGAVPEPGEWALIIIVIFIFLYIRLTR